MFEWKESYAIQVPTIDEQHKKLFSIAAELHAAIMAGQATALTEQILYKLVKYTLVHFQYEEYLLREANFPDFAEHKKLHDDLMARVDGFVRVHKEGKGTNTLALVHLLTEWLVEHIAGTDRTYVPWVKETEAA